jgi:hypothetical protein
VDRRDYTKVFDVSRPSSTAPDPTSKPVIVGHHPMMADPMVRAAHVHPNADVGIETTPHHSKVIQVTDEARQHIAQAQPPSSEELAAAAAAEAKTADIPLPPPMSSQSTSLAAPAPLAPATVQPQTPLPVQQTSVPPAPAPTPEPDLSHIQHVPVSHMPVGSPGRLRSVALWLIVAVFLIIFGLYLAIDAGFINAGVSLPFHIFSRQG